ncbi:MAG: DUF4832 domain-containing protein [Armatimonadetes bacterium]|nr:DUF4832 domain-containing protein [Armatimonadota bacterium]
MPNSPKISRRDFTTKATALVATTALPQLSIRERVRAVTFATTPGALDNPYKGWCPYTNAGKILQPYSMVFRYVTWRELEPREGDYRFTEWERRDWEEPLAKGKHIVFRVHADYPGQPVAIPEWLIKRGVKMTRYKEYGGGLCPDYNNPIFMDAMERLITALGRRYDGHPRVAFVQFGFLGFWGEWHTYPVNNLFASPVNQERVLEAGRRAFPNTILMNRDPAGVAGKKRWLGYFDDMFPEDTDGAEEWKFLPKMRVSGRSENWKSQAIGGEMVPDAAKKWLGDGFNITMERLENAHFSWVGPYCPAIETDPSETFIARSQQMVRRMGYDFAWSQLEIPPILTSGVLFRFTLRGENRGVAPFYHRWKLEFALLDRNGKPVVRIPLRTDIRQFMPGAIRIEEEILCSAPIGDYSLAIGLCDPATNQPGVKFGNDLPVVKKWTVLTDVEVKTE